MGNKFINSLLVTTLLLGSLTAAAQSEEISLRGQAPLGTKIKMTVGYISNRDSFACTRFVWEDFKRRPKVIDIKYRAQTNSAAQFSVAVPLMIDECDADLYSLPSVEVALPGTQMASDLGFKITGSLSVQQVQNNVTDVQRVKCNKIETSKGAVTSCPSGFVFMGPDMKMNLLIEE